MFFPLREGHLSNLCGCNIFSTKAQSQVLKYIRISHIKDQHVREARGGRACALLFCVCLRVYFFYLFLTNLCGFFLRVIALPVATQPVAQVKPPVVAEWGSGVTPRHDPDTISKHVKQMVDVSTVVTLQLQERPFHFLLGRQAKAELKRATTLPSHYCPL